jgi:hypothetical protein
LIYQGSQDTGNRKPGIEQSRRKKLIMKFYLISSLLMLFSAQSLQLGSQDKAVSCGSFLRDEPALLRVSVDESMTEEDPCFGHGGAVAYGVSWYIATCKSNCTRGLGFRCGSETYVRCGDGTTISSGRSGGGCPHSLIYTERNISANIDFFDNNTLKLTFSSALPEEEAGNGKFEIEEDVTLNIPDYLLIGGNHYRSFTLKGGTYRVDREAGEFGSVTVSVILNNE